MRAKRRPPPASTRAKYRPGPRSAAVHARRRSLRNNNPTDME
jgi:hypothetical protein